MARPLIDERIRKAVIARDKACAHCKRPVARVIGNEAPVYQRWRAYDDRGIMFQFDHVIPVSQGGATSEENLVLACPECNLSRARKTKEQKRETRGKTVSKTMKVSALTWQRLDKLRLKGETFDDAVNKLLSCHETLQAMGASISRVLQPTDPNLPSTS